MDPGSAEVAVLDRDGVIVAVNDEWTSFCRDNGGDPERCGVGASYLAVCDAAAGDPVADAVATALRAALAGRAPVPGRVTIPCHTLVERRWYDVHVAPRLGDAGEPLGATVAVIGVEASGGAEASAAAARLGLPHGDLLDVLDLVPDPVLVLDADLCVVHANLTAAGWLGYAPDHLAGRSLAELDADPAGHPGRRADLVRRLEGDDGGSAVVRWEFRTRDGRVVPAEVRVGPAGPGHRRLALVARDVRERDALERRRARQAALASRTAELTTALLAGSAPEDVYGDVAAAAAAVTEADGAAILLPGPDGRLRRVSAAGGPAPAPDEGDPLPRGFADAVLARGRGITLAGAGAVRDLSLGCGPVAASPVVVAHRAHGLIAVTRRPGVEPFAEEDVDLLDRLAVQLGLVIQIARGRSARQRVAVLQDRQRIARDLHDTVIQDLIGLGMAVHAEARHEPDPVRRSRDRDVVDQIDRVVRRLRASVLQLRDRPPGATVTESIESLVAEAARALGHTPALRLAGPVDRLPATVADEVVPVLREALSNVARHARASATCVEVTVGEGGLRIVVEDDGRGPVAIGRGGTGLANLRERAAAHGGRAGLTAREGGRARLTWQCPVGGADGAPVPQR